MTSKKPGMTSAMKFTLVVAVMFAIVAAMQISDWGAGVCG